MAQGAGQRSQLQADVTEARTLLKLTSRQSSQRLERLAAEKEAELSTAQARLADAHRYWRQISFQASIRSQGSSWKRPGFGAWSHL